MTMNPHGQPYPRPYVEPGANPTWMGRVQPANYQHAPGNPASLPQQTWAMPPAPKRSMGTLPLVIGGGILALASLLLVLPFLLGNTGITGFVIGFVASLIPLTVVLLTVRLIDRWEPEPKRLLWFAFTWGAAVSIAGTLLIQPLFALAAPTSSEEAFTYFMATVQAPIVEEFTKSLGLLVLILAARKYFDGPVDGIVFAFTIAAGFAFTENILYFGREIASSTDPGTDFVRIFILRGLMSPFAHAVFTGTTGLIMGFAARRWHPGYAVLAFFVGLLPAMFLHNRWNSMGQDFLVEYFVVQVPIFLTATVGIILLRVAEGKLTRQRLLEYARAGWFTPAEVEMLGTSRGRRQALRWASSRGRTAQMRNFIKGATALAFTRQRILSGRDVPVHQHDELEHLRAIPALRAAVLQ
ncbi:PrsW family intramembrane metalloprotease [Paenarthrobacter sp. UW852]|uniref:PrsW family intramembrane metalloprotease n=1 Tax=Paenarthrobacter sp. UW852 TaxID=2951989 RepID=UPI0021473100|nr:PrsW family intramembrane metalloprotease [Paenarthrobacter sp. UW852]MCR1159990.1 PrsW family intramembrane metalloprotease [Paenarthrobacter sp. UW852]